MLDQKKLIPVWTCEACGLTLRNVLLPVHHKCRPGKVREPYKGPPRTVTLRLGKPSLWRRVLNFLGALRRMVRARFAQRSNREIARLYEICQGCEHFADDKCNKCGCPAKREKVWRNKLAHKGEKCPAGKW